MAESAVTLYTQSGCAPCHAAAEFLRSRGIPFMSRDVVDDPQAFRELMDLGSRTTPTIRIGDEVLVGFDAERLAAILTHRMPRPR